MRSAHPGVSSFPGPPAFEVADGAIAKAFSAIIHHKGHASAAKTWRLW